MTSGCVSVTEVSLARAVVAAVRAVSGVVDVSPGQIPEAATYGPRDRVAGVIVSRAGGVLDIEVHVSVRYTDTLVLPELATRVRLAVRQLIESLGAGPLGPVGVVLDELR